MSERRKTGMNDQEFDGLVERMKQEHHTPPPVPRDRMWARIEAARHGRPVRTPQPSAWRRWGRPALAAAAVLVLGFSIGRMSTRPDAGPLVADAETVTPPAAARAPRTEASPLVRHAAASLFNRADVLLTDLKVSRCAQREDSGAVPAWAGGLLVQTRLLLDTPLADDPDTKHLLQDLELVLVRITGLSTADCAGDVDRIRRDLETNATLDRLRLAAAGPASRTL
jgi:hypothetical protein